MSIKFVSQFSSLSPPEATSEIVQESSHTNSASGTTQQEQQTIAEGTWNFISSADSMLDTRTDCTITIETLTITKQEMRKTTSRLWISWPSKMDKLWDRIVVCHVHMSCTWVLCDRSVLVQATSNECDFTVSFPQDFGDGSTCEPIHVISTPTQIFAQ